MAKVTLVGYGLGNIQAFANIYHRLNIGVVIATKAEQLQEPRNYSSRSWSLRLGNVAAE